jgi:ATP-binding protein involved in chromosome partitioning
LTDVSWGELDYLIIDLPPGTGDAPLTIAQTIPITGILIVTTPQDVAMNVAVKAIGMFNKLNVPIVGVVENMSYLRCPHCNEQIYLFGKGGGKKISEDFGIPFIGEVPLHPGIMESSDVGKPTVISEPDSVQAQSFTKAAKVIAGRISVIAAEMKAQEESESLATEKPKEE